MSMAQEMFRFVTVRRPDRVAMHRINSRLIRDRRTAGPTSLLVTLYGPGEFEPKLRDAEDFAATPDFVAAHDQEMLALEPAIGFFRDRLAPGVVLADLVAEAEVELPTLAALLKHVPLDDVLESTSRFLGRLWDSLYAQTTIGCDRYVSTNHLADGLRVYQVLRLLWLSHTTHLQAWAGGGFDDYEALIDVRKAMAIGNGAAKTAEIVAAADADESFRVSLRVGAMRPPAVGELILVEQVLQRYELGELCTIDSIMRGERREHTIRTLARTSQTTTIETSSELEETSSISYDERFELSSQAQQTANESFGVQAGVTVSGKFGPVQVGASVTASYDNSTSTMESASQDYAKTVTEEATRRVRNSIKETSSVTILSETQDTSLRGFNNEKGVNHVNGLYRWVDRIYTARLLNYGRRLMFSANVPEPSAFFNGLLAQQQAAAIGDLEEPIPPAMISRSTFDPLTNPESTAGYRSFLDISETNYAQIAARYDVSGIQPPPPEFITGSKAIAYPEAMQAIEVKDHDHPNDLSYVSADNTLTVDPNFQVTEVGVYAPVGGAGNHRSFAEALKMGFDKDEENILLVQVGDKSFYLAATGNGTGNPITLATNFNETQEVSEDWLFGDVVKPALPITVTANFEGILTFTVVYTAKRRDEALDAWRSQTYAAVVKGYNAKKQAYDQALTLAQAQSTSDTVAQTYQLREDQYRAIEVAELKRGCIDLLTEGTAAGRTSIAVEEDGTPTIVYDEADASQLDHWRSPLANGSVAEMFETAFEWESLTYQFYPYYWAGRERWQDLAQAGGADPIFEKFLRAGSAGVVVPVRPGYERTVNLFLKTGRVWGGGYLALFNSQDVLDAYADVECGLQLDPPEQIGESWEIRVPTSMVMLQEDDTLPVFPAAEEPAADEPVTEPVPDERVPF